MLDIPKKGSIEWVEMSAYYRDLIKEGEKELARKYPEGHEDRDRAVAEFGEMKVEAERLADKYAGVSFAVRNLGRSEVQLYSMEIQRIRAEEFQSKLKARKSASRDVAPELYADGTPIELVSPELGQKAIEVARGVVSKFIDGARGLSLNGVPLKESGEDPKNILEVVDFLAIHSQLTHLVMKSQGLSGLEVLS